MNVFVLCTGRCGSTTFIEAAKHIDNFTAAHESRTMFAGNERFSYPLNHIEADNRLSWLLGRLDLYIGADAYYVHLQRDLLATSQSFIHRWNYGIMKAYHTEILMGADKIEKVKEEKLLYCMDYCETVNANITLFLRDKPHKMDFRLECAERDWRRFWNWIGAEGNQEKALNEWKIKHNARKSTLDYPN